MPVSMSELEAALDFVSTDGGGMNEAFLCRRTGKIYWRSSDLGDEFEELPDDLEESENYIAVPGKRELDLGKPLVLDFAAESAHTPQSAATLLRCLSQKPFRQ